MKTFILLLIFLSFHRLINAENLYSFSIQDSYLSSGKVKIDNTGTTTIKFDVTFARTAGETCNIQFELVAIGNGNSGAPLAISSPFSLTTSDFNSGPSGANTLFLTKTYTVTIAYSLVQNETNIFLGWVSIQDPGSLPPAGVNFYSSTNQYPIVFVSPAPPPPAYSCTDVTTINSGTIASGKTKNGYINIGPGSGTTITINSTANTSLVAVENIIINSEFKATVTTGTFTASLTSCANLPTARPENIINDSIIEDNNLQIFPVPTSGQLIVKGKQTLKNVNVSLYNQLGEKVFEESSISPKNELELNLSSMRNGIYFIKISTSDKTISRKIIINK